MPVDVTWDGVSLAKSATVREQDGGWFVELEQPMPVGTTITLAGDVQATVEVARVHEGIGAGMLLKTAVSHQPSAPGSGAEEAGEKKEKRKKKR
jgi:hypothetical protein